MTSPVRTAAGLLLTLTLQAAASGAPGTTVQPIARDRFVADPSARVFDGRVYLYATDDSDNDGKYWNSKDWRLYSSADMTRWHDHGKIFDIAGLAWAKGLAWAPDALYYDGHTYLFLPVDRTKIGLARADKPTGPFVDALGGPLVDTARDANAGDEPIDPAAFVDDDGTPYLYFGTRVPKVVKLRHDLRALDGPIRDLEIREAKLPYGEAPWLHRYRGKYYLRYSTGWPGQIVYAIGDSPAGPFVQQGVLFDRVSIATNHHAIVEKDGRWWFFFHDAVLPGGGEHRRSVCVAPMQYRADGTIEPIRAHCTAKETR